jgi:hypothetical protein
MQQQTANFDFPITDFGTNPPQFVDNLSVHFKFEIGRNKEPVNVGISKIVCFDGGAIGTHIHRLIKAINPAMYYEILEAAKQHAKGYIETIKTETTKP